MPGVPSNYEFQRDGSEIYKDQQAMLSAKVLGGSPQILSDEGFFCCCFLILGCAGSSMLHAGSL